MCIEQYCYLYDELYIGTFYHIESQITKYYTHILNELHITKLMRLDAVFGRSIAIAFL